MRLETAFLAMGFLTMIDLRILTRAVPARALTWADDQRASGGPGVVLVTMNATRHDDGCAGRCTKNAEDDQMFLQEDLVVGVGWRVFR